MSTTSRAGAPATAQKRNAYARLIDSLAEAVVEDYLRAQLPPQLDSEARRSERAPLPARQVAA